MMTQENKELLLKDLCARLPYGVKIRGVDSDGEVIVEELFTIGIDGNIFDCNMIELSKVEPYLFPLSSMTEEQRDELELLCDGLDIDDEGGWMNYIAVLGSFSFNINLDAIDWLNKNHFDYRGLIEKGLAINATKLNIY